jgi:hypothetical protein
MEYVLAGLDGDYDNLVETVNNRDNPMSPQDLYSRLMYTEQRVEVRRTAQVITDPVAVVLKTEPDQWFNLKKSEKIGTRASASFFSALDRMRR